MKMKQYRSLNEAHKDILREVGNIGTGNALTALAKLIGDGIDMGIPAVNIVDRDNLDSILKGKNSLYVGVVLQISGDLECVIAFMLNRKFASLIVEKLVGEEDVDIHHLSPMAKSALCELGNIMGNSYLTALAMMTGTKLNTSVPYMCVDSAERILDIFITKYTDDAAEMMFIDNRFNYGNEDLQSHIFLHPQVESLNGILEKLGV